MIELVFTVCSLLEGAKCKEQSLVFQDLSLMTCLVGAQPQLARWAEGHPNWTVSKWTCRQAGMFAKA